jgi:hypothetical protein
MFVASSIYLFIGVSASLPSSSSALESRREKIIIYFSSPLMLKWNFLNQTRQRDLQSG